MLETRHLTVRGQVQGVGFRPFVFRLATHLGLTGEVCNRSSAVDIVVQGERAVLDVFRARLPREAPGQVEDVHCETLSAPLIKPLNTRRYEGFRIMPSRGDAGIASVLLADRGICSHCLAEFNDPGDRRYRYAFIGCTSCGPRYAVCQQLPFDRENTSWRAFPPCEDCQAEFAEPGDRRFHAVSISCPRCGPRLFTPAGAQDADALDEAAAAIAGGGIVAVRGIAGFHLLVDATNSAAIARLRRRKRRHKPLAILAPDLDWIVRHARVEGAEEVALASPVRPIVLLDSVSENENKVKNESAITHAVAPGTGTLGVMLPASAIQHGLLQRLRRPLVATSGNLGGTPLLYENAQAREMLAGVADAFLLHELELTCGLDDSVQRVMAGRPVNLRLGRGLAPQVHRVPGRARVLGCGAHLKVNVAFQEGDLLVVGPYIGDLEGAQTRERYRLQKQQLPALFQAGQVQAGQIEAEKNTEVTDLHPDYASTIDADYRARTVPHHVAHAMAAWVEHQPVGPFLALTWDGIGLGPDGTVWGGECLQFDAGLRWRRLGSIRPFALPAGHDSARYPGRIARVLAGGTLPGQSVSCTSMGRLIEGLAALAGVRGENDYEAQVAMEWEALARGTTVAADMDFGLAADELDWRPLLPVIMDGSIDLAARARGFHLALARAALRQCAIGEGSVVLLSGGVFQNRLLVELLLQQGRALALDIRYPQRLPPNDGGISAGQCVAVAMAVQHDETLERCA